MDGKIFETTIILDEEKIDRSRYSEDDIYEYLQGVFHVVGMVREGKTFKHGTLAEVGVAMSALWEKAWFMKVVKEWTLSIREDGVITHTENVLASRAVRSEYLDKYGL